MTVWHKIVNVEDIFSGLVMPLFTTNSYQWTKEIGDCVALSAVYIPTLLSVVLNILLKGTEKDLAEPRNW